MQNLNRLIYIGFFASVVCLFLSIKACSNHADEYNQAKGYLCSLGDTIVNLKDGIAQAKSVSVSKDLFASIVKENDGLKKLLKDADIKVKNVKQSTRIITVTQIDTIKIKLHDTIPGDFNPVRFSVDSVDYSISGSVSKTSISIGKIQFPDSIYVISAEKKHFFRKDEYVALVKHSNSHIKTIGITNLTITDKKKLYQSGWIKFGAGVLVGFFALGRL